MSRKEHSDCARSRFKRTYALRKCLISIQARKASGQGPQVPREQPLSLAFRVSCCSLIWAHSHASLVVDLYLLSDLDFPIAKVRLARAHNLHSANMAFVDP